MKRGPSAAREENRGWGLKSYSRDQLEAIHEATLEVLRLTGVEFHSEEALDVLEAGGCIVDRGRRVVRFPAYVVEGAIATAPRQILLAARDPRHDFLLGGRRIGFTNFGCGIKILRPETDELLESTKEDVGIAARLCDATENVDICATALVARDMPDSSYDLHMLEQMFLNTSKHVTHVDVSGGTNARRMFEMAALIAGGKDELRERPLMSILTCPTSPLMIHESVCEIVMEGARWGIPVLVLSMVMAGATGPVTLSGALVTHNAEVLAGITLAQLTCPGAPSIYGSSTTILDMSCGNAPLGAPEEGMICAAAGGLAQMYGLPSWTSGAWADSKVEDAQSGHEKTISAILPALAGVNMMYGMGVLESGMTFSPAQLMIDNEIVAMVKRVVEGSVVNDDVMGVDVIHRVGSGKNFLKEKHTLQYVAGEQAKVHLFDRRTRGAWEKRGATTAAERGGELAVRLLDTHTPLPLDPGIHEDMRAIITEAEEAGGLSAGAHTGTTRRW
ncbi:MAG: trimethylamine methyltransferase family protein [Actinobacteria bacterium]|nr:trimethylamine methyltransferase family protein [Actinomycetota bacterium]